MKSWPFAAGLVGLILAGAGVALPLGLSKMKATLRKAPLDPPRLLRSVPAESESWVREGQDRLETPEVVETLGTQNYLTRLMVHRTKRMGDHRVGMQVHAAYYTGMIDTVPHVPDRCFVGGGMQKASAAESVPVPLDLTSVNSMFRLGSSDRYLERRTPEAYRPLERGGARDVYYIRLSSRFSERKGEFVRVPFDPAALRIRVSSFRGEGARPLFAGYFFIANGGVTDNADAVRLLAFKLQDQYAYYMKVQFTSDMVSSAEELAALAADYLNENLGELLLCSPDWIDVRMAQDEGRDPNVASKAEVERAGP